MKNRGKEKEEIDLGPRQSGFQHSNSKKKKHLGGKGLSLTAFANAKTKTDFNPAQLKKQREYYRNAKNVKKYRKLLKQLGDGDHDSQLQMDTSALELSQETLAEQKYDTIEQQLSESDVNDNGPPLPTVKQKFNNGKNGFSQKNKGKNGYNQKQKGTNDFCPQNKGKNTLQKLREDYEKQKQEEERLRKEREDAIAVKHEGREKAESKRRDLKSKMCKRTRSGQPIMKFRMEHLLDKIQNSN